ncbi:OmpA family protein [Flavobacterium rhizosphaerae]|uniref:OmpA family protein n=1 Tax=Flavobacterium rhizosphaerae TaxID=3163298 RepID=A0ABW8YUQ2_9FLAO
MKKIVLPLLFLGLATTSLSAQESGANDFNKFSIDFGGGFNKAANPMTEGYHMKTTNLFNANLGFRYMFNTKFGVKLEGYYDKFQEDDISRGDFDTNVMGGTLQAYINLGRVLDFQTWTQRLNLYTHLGVGISVLKGDNIDYNDRLGNVVMGIGAKYKISRRIAFDANFTMLNNFSQQRTWDGNEYDRQGKQGFDSTLYHATIGFNIYLGKHEEHADWYVDEKSDELEELENRIGELETMMDDSDKDGVPDYLDAEPNTITGVAVDSKGRTIDRNNNGVPDELESYVESKVSENNSEMRSQMGLDLAKLINGGYVNVYFDFNKDMPNAQSVGGINFLVKYLKENPSTGADVIGYADEVGNNEYNKQLSQRRAENVKKILVDSGIEASRLNIVGNGEDSSVNPDSPYARQIVRRVTFILK